MRNLPIDASKFQLIATGKVIPKPAYVEMADGSRRKDPNGRQETDPATGLPVWTVDCISGAEDDDDRRVETVGVTVTSPNKPVVQKFAPVQFEGLTANGYVQNGSRFVSYSFRATGVVGGSAAGSGGGRASKSAEAA